MRTWDSHAAPDVCEAILERLVPGPTVPEPVCRTLRAASACVIRAWLRMYHRFTIAGLEHLPPSGRFVMICNHSSHLDGLCLLSALPIASLHRTYPAAAADYFFNSPTAGIFSRIVMNAVPLHRDASVRQSLAACRALLREDAGNPGNVLILFPEGTRSTSGAVGPFRRGIGDPTSRSSRATWTGRTRPGRRELFCRFRV